MQSKSPMRYALSMAIAAALAPTLVAAQDAATPASRDDGNAAQAAGELDTLVVSGSAKFRGVRKRDASYSISTANEDDVREAAPASTADLLKIVPGVLAESSGGGTGANVFVRDMPSEGDAPFFTLQLDGSPISLPPTLSTLSFLENTTLFRIDDTVEHVEGRRGGPRPIFSNGQPGVTVDFIQKKGGDAPTGSVCATLGTDALRRIDVFQGGPLGEGRGWSYSVGGFWRETDGVRHIGYPAEQGGQIVGTLTRRRDTGEFTLYGRRTDDRNAFYTAIPLRSRNNGRSISGFPGIDATSGTLIGDDFRRVTLPIGIGIGIGNGTMRRDVADGRGNARVIGNATSAGVFMGRPIEGASYQVSAAYRW